MSKILAIAKRETRALFDSLMAYITIVVFLLLCGIFVWVSPDNILAQGEASLRYFFLIAGYALLFLCPAISMRSLSEEYQTGTIELLATKSISDWQIVLGKFLASYFVVLVAIVSTVIYWISLAQIGDVDTAATIGGYLGLILLAALYVAVGVLMSSFTGNQIIAFLLSLMVNLMLHLIIGYLATASSGTLGLILYNLSAEYHLDSLARGLVDSRDVLYFILLSALALLGARANLNRRNPRISRRQYSFSGIATLIAISIYVVSYFAYFSLDLTEEKRFTLSDSTKSLVGSLEEPVTFTFYFTEDLPPAIETSKREVLDKVKDLRSAADVQVVFSVINPNVSLETERKAQQKGIQPQILEVTEQDQVQQRRVYLGAEVRHGTRSQVIGQFDPQANIEYQLMTALTQVATAQRRQIGILADHGAGRMDMEQVADLLEVQYGVRETTIEGVDSFDAVVLADVKDSIPGAQLQLLDKYLEGGGKMLIATSNMAVNLSEFSGNQNLVNEKRTNFDDWLRAKGISIEPNLVVSANAGQVNVPQQVGEMMIPMQVTFPFSPIITDFSDHPITAGFTGLMMAFSSQVEVRPGQQMEAEVLARTGSNSGVMKAPVLVEVQRQWSQKDFPKANIPVAVAATMPGGGRLAVFGSGLMMLHVGNRQALPMQNADVMVNAVDWLVDETGLVELRSKKIASRPLPVLSESERILYKYGNLLLPVLVIVGLGIWRVYANRLKRRRWRVGEAKVGTE